MKILNFLFLFFLLINTAYCQKIDAPSAAEVLPPSPNSYELTRYSGLPINHSSGSVQAKVPLAILDNGRMQLPISVGYNSGNGLKVNQIASRVGMNWTLDAGGVITRTVHGNPDENSQWLTPPSSFSAFDNDQYEYLDEASSGLYYDTQPDIFSFEFNGYSGRFYLSPANGQVIMLNKVPLKIEVDLAEVPTSGWNFRIIDDKGVKYFFGGTLATEKTKTNPYGSSCGKNFESFIPTAWYLKKIEDRNGDSFNFSYVAAEFQYLVDFNQRLVRTPFSTPLTLACPASYCEVKIENYACASNLITTGVLLKSIEGRFSKAVFNYIAREDLQGDSLLSGIEIYKKEIVSATEGLDNSFSFEYIYGSNTTFINVFENSFLSKRAFLNKITHSAPGEAPESHVMDYYNINGIASRLSFAQDYWGYFNGINNLNFVPNAEGYVHNSLFTNLADRTPNGAVAKYGLLKSISYPTGGKDSLEYEPNTVYGTRMQPGEQQTILAQLQGVGFKGEVVQAYPFEITADQDIELEMSAQFADGFVDSASHYTIFSIVNSTNTPLYTQLVNIGSTYTQIQHLTPGNYNLILKSYGEATIGNGNLKYKDSPVAVTKNHEAGGVRISKNTSIPKTGTPLVKKYIYSSLENQQESSGILRSLPDPERYFSNTMAVDFCLNVVGDTLDLPANYMSRCEYVMGSSEPSVSLFYPSGQHIVYENVIEVQDEDWENGGIERTFAANAFGSDANVVMGKVIPGAPLSESNFEFTYEKRNRSFIKTGLESGVYNTKIIQETSNSYAIDPRGRSESEFYIVNRRWMEHDVRPVQAFMFDPFDVSMYYLTTKWYYLDTTTTITYDIEGLNPVTTKTVYKYDNPLHMQPSEVSISNSDGTNTKYVYKYAHDMVSDGVLDPYTQMVNNNRVSDAIIQSEYTGSVPTHVSTLYKAYNTWHENIIEPQKIQMKYGNSLDYIDLYDFKEYDTFGRLLMQSQSEGPDIGYKYGYGNSLLIAEAKNATNDEFYVENFEEDPLATIGNAHTGKRYHIAPYTVNWEPPSGRSYVLSYRFLNEDNIWEYKEEAYSGSSAALTGGSAFDDIRIFPDNAQVTTYTYIPETGIESMTDPAGRTTHYTYDNFGRLVSIADDVKNIKTAFKYNLVGEDGPLTYTNVAQSGSFTRNNCGTGGSGGTVTYTIAAGSYTSTVSQADANALALAAVNSGGQAYANTNGTCTYTNVAQSGSFTRNNCGTGGTGSTVTYTIAAGSYTSTVSQADANALALAAVNSGGQAYANTNGTCTYTNVAQSGSFTRNNCGTGGTGSTVTYTIAAGSYTSTVSQADANALALAAVNSGGQAYANTNGTCTYHSVAKSGSFTRNNCGTGGTGSTVTYTIAAGAYSSTISQADADSKAVAAVNSGGQAYANTNGTCTYHSVVKSGSFTRNNCGTGGTGSTVTYTIAAGAYSSTISQADADSKAVAAVNSGGQAYANTNGTCTYHSVAKSGSFTRNNCGTGGTGGTVTYTIAAGAYSSTISQADADSKAVAAVNSGGQAYANTNGTCTYHSVAKSGSFTRNNCGTGGTGSTVTYTIAAGAYSSTISQADADSKAVAAVNSGGQAYANTNGTCTYHSVVKSGSFTRNNCGTGGTGSAVTYTIAAGAYSSTISQADADSKAVAAVNSGGQAYANTNGTCTYHSVAKSGSFTRNNCGTGGTGSTVIYIIAAGTYSSTISQADADSKAVAAVNSGGQAYANANGTCTYYNVVQSGTFTRNNCGAGVTGGSITYGVPAGTYSSTISLADANAKALTALNTNGQAYANTNGTCTYYNSVAYSDTFDNTTCGAGGVPGSIVYTIPVGTYSSTVSQFDANQIASQALYELGPAYANAHTVCTYYNDVQSAQFTRNNCAAYTTGTTVTYTIAAATYSSTVSKAAANATAIAALTAGGQAYANANGTCSSGVLFRIRKESGPGGVSKMRFVDNSSMVEIVIQSSDIDSYGYFEVPAGSYQVFFDTIEGGGSYIRTDAGECMELWRYASFSNVNVGPVREFILSDTPCF